MPQEAALIEEFTIREMISFYGTLFGLSSDKIKDRIKFLVELLELPEEDKLIGECSGGQQRRVSFALTLVHEPELLILDEPTVGLDPLLRAKIWDYLIEITTNHKITVLMSTHYVEEAKQSNQIGLMRNGVLVAEDSPQNILSVMQTESLEEAFLILSENQQNNAAHNNLNDLQMETLEQPASVSQPYKPRAADVELTTLRIMIALLTKNALQVLRNVP